MDAIKLVGSLENNAEELLSSTSAKDPANAEIRSLGDWELVLVAGGEGSPYWP